MLPSIHFRIISPLFKVPLSTKVSAQEASEMASQTEENSAFAEETVPFLAQETPPTIQTPAPDQPRSRFEITNAHEEGKRTSKIKRRLYVSHFLSTWNSRVFEFAAVLFLAHIFEGTLLPTSVYALCRAASAIVFAPMVGRYVDREDRLKVVRVSIGKFICIHTFEINKRELIMRSTGTSCGDTVMHRLPCHRRGDVGE